MLDGDFAEVRLCSTLIYPDISDPILGATLNTRPRNFAVSISSRFVYQLQDQGFVEFPASMGKQMKFCKPDREADLFYLVLFVRFPIRISASKTLSFYCCRYSARAIVGQQ